MGDNKIPDNKIKNKKEKKPVTMKQLIIRKLMIIFAFALMSIGITTFLIIYKPVPEDPKKDVPKIDIVQEKEKEKVKHEGLINLDKDTYNLNDLKVTEFEEEFQGLKINYYQIDGLINKSIQASINYNLKNDLEVAVTNAIKENKVIDDSFYCYCYLSSNFANTLSIYYSIVSDVYNTSKDEHELLLNENIVENYDLTTGERIRFNDVFTDDTAAQKIFNSSLYTEMIPNYTEQKMDEDEWYIKVTDYKDIEEEMFLLVNKFNNKQNINFVFDEQKITLVDYWSSIYYEDILDNIAIYNRYKTSSNLFDGKYKTLDDLPVLVKRANADYELIDQGENYYIDISLKCSDFENKEVYNSAVNYINSEVAEIKEKAKKTEKFIIANYHYDINERGFWDSYWNEFVSEYNYNLNITKYEYETTKSMFNAKLHDKIISIFRKTPRIETGEAYLYDNIFMYYLDDEQESLEYDNSYDTLYLDSIGNIYDTEDDLYGLNYFED